MKRQARSRRRRRQTRNFAGRRAPAVTWTAVGRSRDLGPTGRAEFGGGCWMVDVSDSETESWKR